MATTTIRNLLQRWMMLFETKADQAQKKDDPPQAQDQVAAPEQNKSHGATEPASHSGGAQAAALMSHWAEPGGATTQAGAADGPSHMGADPRFSEKADVVSNGHGRILKVDIVGGSTRITIGLGSHQGVHPGMMGYIKKGNGMLADFQIESVKDKVAVANVDVTPDQLKDHSDVVINPGQMPKSSEEHKNLKARLLKIDIVGGMTQISIGLGASRGARAGMAGIIVGRDGRAFAHFQLDAAHATYSTAFVDRTFDALKDHDEILLNPS